MAVLEHGEHESFRKGLDNAVHRVHKGDAGAPLRAPALKARGSGQECARAFAFSACDKDSRERFAHACELAQGA
jgi:hypothetical protein